MRLTPPEADLTRLLGTAIPPELELLTAFDQLARLRAASSKVDWQIVTSLAARQRLSGQLITALERAGIVDVPPTAVVEELRRRRERTRRRFVTVIRPEMLEVCAALLEAGIRPTVLKGAALVLDAVLAPGLRPMRDLDLLVARQQLPAASAALRRLGYEYRVGPDIVRWSRTHHYQDPALHHPRRRLEVELHWHVLTPRHRLFFPAEALVMRPLTIDGLEIDRLDAADMLDHLVLHLWNDLASGKPRILGELWDLYHALEALDADSQQQARERSRSRGHPQVLAAVLAIEELLLHASDPRRERWSTSGLDPGRLQSIAARRVLSPRPAPAQLLMVTNDVNYSPWRLLTRLAAQLRRPQRVLADAYGSEPPWRLRVRHLGLVSRLLFELIRSPLEGIDELRLDRWAHQLR